MISAAIVSGRITFEFEGSEGEEAGRRRGERWDQDHSVDRLMGCNTVAITGPSLLLSPFFPLHFFPSIYLSSFLPLFPRFLVPAVSSASTFSSVFFFFSPSKELSPIANQFSVATESGASASMTSSSLPLRVALLSAIFSQRAHTGRTCVSDTCARVPYPLVEVSPTRCVYATCSLPGFVIFHPEN